MSLMCKIGNKCCATKGMCVHEKMMMVVVIVGVGAIGHWVLHWF